MKKFLQYLVLGLCVLFVLSMFTTILVLSMSGSATPVADGLIAIGSTLLAGFAGVAVVLAAGWALGGLINGS